MFSYAVMLRPSETIDMYFEDITDIVAGFFLGGEPSAVKGKMVNNKSLMGMRKGKRKAN